MSAVDSLPFTKMSGAGNDFIVLDNRALRFRLTPQQVALLCDRHRGIGADGILAVEPAGEFAADFRMRYYNADGGEAEMCGNGARCFARFVQSMPRAEADRVRFHTPAGLIAGEYLGSEVRVSLTAPGLPRLRQRADFGWGEIEYHFIDTGVPHTVVFVDDVQLVDLVAQGRAIRRSPLFPKGTNVNFVQVLDPANLSVRTYERGVEDETLACGTGVTASALLTSRVQGAALPLRIQVRSGDVLTVDARLAGETFRDVTLTGPAVTTFTGEFRLERSSV
jgi:diaminopimelate epimerase